jgi:hypothetical protein
MPKRTAYGFLRGKKLAVRLEELAQVASDHYGAKLEADRRKAGHEVKAMEASREALEHARAAGAALQEAKERLGHRGKWSRWLRANFSGSWRVSRQYRQIHRWWDHPRIVKAREAGQCNSIQQFLKAYRQLPARPSARTLRVERIVARMRTWDADRELNFDRYFDPLFEDIEAKLDNQAAYDNERAEVVREWAKGRRPVPL